ncbi:MAG: hypothetical protein RLZZ165_2483 [Bacteroidota bacterium]
MENIQDLPCLRVENEPVKELQRAKKRVLRNFKLSTQRTQLELNTLVQDLFIYNRIQELQELCRFVIRQGCIDSAFLSTVYAIYVYTKKNEPKGSEYYTAWEILNKVGPLEYDDLFDACDKDLAEAKSENLGIGSMLSPLQAMIGFIMRDIVHGENSLFGVEFLEAKLQATLAEIRALLKIKL